MFARVLLDSPAILMSINWFGLGALRVTDRRSGYFAEATPEVRKHFLDTLAEMKRLGVRLDPSDHRTTATFIHYGRVIVSPDPLAPYNLLSRSPARLAAVLAVDVE